MATPQQLQNALMLKKTQGLTTEQAVNQSRVPVTATSQINQDRLAQNQASRQNAQVVQNQPIANLPVDPSTGLSSPLEQAKPLTPITPEQKQAVSQPLSTQDQATIDRMTAEWIFWDVPRVDTTKLEKDRTIDGWVKPLPKLEAIDYTQAKGRESEITANLDSFKAKWMTTDEIMRASDYQNASPEKKALIEPYLKQTVPTASAMYNNIVAKADIPEEMKQTPSYRIANNRYMKANMYSTMTPSQLSSEMTNSKLIQGSQAYEDLKAMNPKLVQDTENLRIVNGAKQNIFTYTNNPDGTPVKVNNLEESFKSDFEDNFGDFIKQMYAVQTPDQIRAIIYTPDAQQANDKATAIELEMNELEKQIDNVDSDVDKEMAGSGATGSRISLEKAIRKDKLEKSYNSALKNYTTYANKANSIINQNTTIFQEQQKQQQQQNAAMLPFITDQYKTAQAKAQAEAALADPQTQIEATMKEFADMWIVAQGNTASKIAEFKKSGLSLPDYITQLRGQFMSKPEYQKIQALKSGALSDAEKFRMQNEVEDRRDLRNFAQQKEMAQIAKDNARSQFLWELENDPEKKAKVLEYEQKLNAGKSLFDILGKNVGTYEGNRGYDLAWNLWDPLPAGGNWKVKSIDNAGEQVGSIFIGGKWQKPYWNTVVMVDENGNEIRYSHLQNIGVKQGDVLWFGDIVGTRGNTGNVMGANGEKLTAEQLASGRGSHLDVEIKNSTGKLLSNTEQVNFLKGLKASWINGSQYSDEQVNNLAYLVELQEKNPSEASKQMKEMWYSSKDMANFKAGNVPLTERQKLSSTDVMNAIADLADPSKYEWNDATGLFAGWDSISGSDAANAEIAIDNLVAKLTLPNLWVLKWPMSDKDIAFIKAASSKLDRNQSDASFERNLIDAYNLSARRAWMPEITKLSDIKSGVTPKQQTVGWEASDPFGIR